MLQEHCGGWAPAVVALIAAIGATTGTAHAQPVGKDINFESARLKAVAAKEAERRALETRQRRCADADLNDDELLRASNQHADLLQKSADARLERKELEAIKADLGKLALSIPATAAKSNTKRSECDWAKHAATEKKSLRETALQTLSTVAALGVDGRVVVATNAPAPAATPASAAAAGKPAPLSPPGFAPLAHELRNLVETAAKAQDEAEGQRKSLAGIYDEVDKATAQALDLKQIGDAQYLEDARRLQHQVDASRSERRSAQAAATDLVDKALRMKSCALAYDAACAEAMRDVYRDGRIAQDVHERALQRSKALADEALDTALRINIAHTHADAKSRVDAYRFAKVLQDHPDSNAPFAKDSFQILAGRDSAASLQFGLNSLLPKGWSRVSAKVSTPLTEGKTDLFGSADGLANSRSVSLAWQAGGLRGKVLATDNWLWATSLQLGSGYQTREYYEDGPTAFTKGITSQTVQPSEIGAAFALHEAGGRNAHLLTIKGQRTHELKPAEIRCPVDKSADLAFVSCVNGSFGPPTAERALVLGYEYRFKGTDFALSPSVAYNTRSHVTTFGLPLYLVRSADDDKRPLNAGFRLERSSKGKTSITGKTESNWSWGVFVGAPFKLFGLPD